MIRNVKETDIKILAHIYIKSYMIMLILESIGL